MAAVSDAEWFARTALSCVADPGDPVLGALLRVSSPAEVLAAICAGRAPEPGPGQPGQAAGPEQELGPEQQPGGPARGLSRALERWAARLGSVPTDSRIAAWRRAGIRIICPGDPEWPTQLGDAQPVLLWAQGNANLRYACLRSVSMVGARAATGYGSHVCTEMTAALAQQGWTVISSGP
jgi:DNA processing protein